MHTHTAEQYSKRAAGRTLSTHTHTHARAHAHARTHARTHTHTHTHTQAGVPVEVGWLPYSSACSGYRSSRPRTRARLHASTTHPHPTEKRAVPPPPHPTPTEGSAHVFFFNVQMVILVDIVLEILSVLYRQFLQVHARVCTYKNTGKSMPARACIVGHHGHTALEGMV